MKKSSLLIVCGAMLLGLVGCTPNKPVVEPCVEHVDADNNGKCDVCGADVEVKEEHTEHVDANHDGKCDVCEVEVPVTHIDENGDDKCDVCGASLLDLASVQASSKKEVEDYRAEVVSALNKKGTFLAAINEAKTSANTAIDASEDRKGCEAAVDAYKAKADEVLAPIDVATKELEEYRKSEIEACSEEAKTEASTLLANYKTQLFSGIVDADGIESTKAMYIKAIDLLLFKQSYNSMEANYFANKKTFYADFLLDNFMGMNVGLVTWEIVMDVDGSVALTQIMVAFGQSMEVEGTYKLANPHVVGEENQISFLIGEDQYGDKLDLKLVDNNYQFIYNNGSGDIICSTVQDVFDETKMGKRNPFKEKEVVFKGSNEAANVEIFPGFSMPIPAADWEIRFTYNNHFTLTSTLNMNGEGRYNLVVDENGQTTITLAKGNGTFDWVTATIVTGMVLNIDQETGLRSFDYTEQGLTFTLTEEKAPAEEAK